MAPVKPRRVCPLMPEPKLYFVLFVPPKKSWLGGGQDCKDDVTLFHKKKKSVYLRGEAPRAFPGVQVLLSCPGPAACLPCLEAMCPYLVIETQSYTSFFVPFFNIWGIVKKGRGSVCVGTENPSPCSSCSHFLEEMNPSLESWGS